MNENRIWWNKLDENWKIELMSNLFIDEDNGDILLEIVDKCKIATISDKNISAVVNLRQVSITQQVLYDLSPLDYLKNLKSFQIDAPHFKDENAKDVLEMYPKHLRSKVRDLHFEDIYVGDDFTVFSDFNNLESLHVKGCDFKSLKGIQKLKRLRTLTIAKNNYPLYLKYLVRLPIKTLNLEKTPINNLIPLKFMRSLRCLILDSLIDVVDYWTLSNLRNIELYIANEYVEQTLSNLEAYLRNETRGKIIGRHGALVDEIDVTKINTGLMLDDLNIFLPQYFKYN